ncbi:hypothetical protein [Sphingopyxis witflariensis]|uniref:Uncharacterized protein n=1 Tax=Sphingopyxis witflariensis TaxID=173675 RepID=A0A246JY46_9SPHN|nr:hypothetical protein [Sphingopyxis witflariensis]OWQ98005.1 hypothetical protein CDQ91_10320 [Sphingopyxis witflariensis]
MTITETIARAIADGLKSNAVYVSNDLRKCIVDGGLFDLQDLAAPIISALADAGYAIVPIEPTQDMISAGIIERHDQPTPEAWSLATENIYRAMIEAGRVIHNGA